jgi:hypothetical protein
MNTYDTIWSYRQVPLTVYAFASAADWAMTTDALSIGFREANPIMAQLSPVGMLLGKLLALAVAVLVAVEMDRVRPSWTLPALWLVAAGQSAVIVWNILILALTGGVL